MFEIGDRVRYRGREGVIVTKHRSGKVNVVFGSTYSSSSEGIWPIDADAHVDPEDVEPLAVDETEDAGEPIAEDDVDDSTDEEDVDDEPDNDDFDAEWFVDRTPQDEVVADIETGEYDDVLDAIEAAEEAGRDRNGVADAIEARRED